MVSARLILNRTLASVLFAAAVLCGLTLDGRTGQATITEQIDGPNAALSGFTGPYATVDINRVDNNTANIVFTSLTTNGVTFLIGDGGTADLNVNGAYTLGTVTETGLAGFTPTFKDNSPNSNVNGFGIFSLSLDNSDGYGSSANPISFLITNSTGLWTSDAAVLVNNAGGYNAAIHAFACNSPCMASGTALTTGYAAKKIPEPTSLALLGTALTGLGIVARRRRRG